MIALFLILIAFFGFAAFGSESSSTGTAPAVAPARVPAVTGLPRATAERRIRQAGLVPSASSCATSGSAFAVKIQRPSAGTTVPRGTSVTIRIATRGGTPCRAVSGARP